MAGQARQGAEVSGLQRRIVQRDPRQLTRLEVNARFMAYEEYQQLVANIRRDGCLTSVPLIYGGGEYAEGAELIVSGNHRCDAAVDAGLEQVDCILIDSPQARDELIARQLSHNAIAGQDDPATLKQLYDQIEDIDWRAYAGLDDQELELLSQVSMENLGEPDLNFQTIQLVFLPPELDAAKKALETARSFTDGGWLAAYRDYEPTLDALASVHSAYNIGNVATALGIVLSVFERHLTDLQEGYANPGTMQVRRGRVNLEVIFGSRDVKVPDAQILTKAVRAAEKRGDAEPGQGWQLLLLMADTYLARLEADP